MAKELKLPSGKEKVLTTHGEKYWGAYLFLFNVVFVAGFLRLIQPQMNPYGGTFFNYVLMALPGIACIPINFFAHYIQALKQDPNEFYNPAFGINDDENCFIEGREGEGRGKRYLATKPTHAQWARRELLGGPLAAWFLG